MRSLSSSAPSSLPLRSSPPFPHSSLRWGSPPPALQPRSFSSGFASKRSAATFGAAKLRRVSPLLPRRCRRVAGPASAGWLQRALGSPPSPDLSPSRLSPAHGSLARQRALRAARLGRSSDELDRSHLSSQLKRAVQVLSAAGSFPSWRSNGKRDFTEALMATTREHRYAVSLTWNGNLGTGTSFSSGRVSTEPGQPHDRLWLLPLLEPSKRGDSGLEAAGMRRMSDQI